MNMDAATAAAAAITAQLKDVRIHFAQTPSRDVTPSGVTPAPYGSGPLIRDRLHFFGSYEGNYQNRSNRVNFVPPTGFPARDTVNLAQYTGNFTSPFRERLLFG